MKIIKKPVEIEAHYFGGNVGKLHDVVSRWFEYKADIRIKHREERDYCSVYVEENGYYQHKALSVGDVLTFEGGKIGVIGKETFESSYDVVK